MNDISETAAEVWRRYSGGHQIAGIPADRLRELLDVLEGRKFLGHTAQRKADQDCATALTELLALRHQGPALASFTEALKSVPAREEHYALTELVDEGRKLLRALGVEE
jgi:hypothetical protein